MSISQLEVLYEAAISALESGNYGLAIQKALACKMRLAAMPNVERDLAGGGKQRLDWANVQALDGFISQCKQLQQSAQASSLGPIQRTKIRYARPVDYDE